MSTAMLSTWQSACGIADFTANYCAALQSIGIETTVVPIDRDYLESLSRSKLVKAFRKLASELSDHPTVHIQHEFGFFTGRFGMLQSLFNFHLVLGRLALAHCRVVITFHTALPFSGDASRIASPFRRVILQTYWRFGVVRVLDKIEAQTVVHTDLMKQELVRSGLPSERVSLISHPVPTTLRRNPTRSSNTDPLRPRLVVLPGFVSSYKGHLVAAEALRHLPDQYHLVIAGGANPANGSDNTVEILEAIARDAPRSRIAITGYLELHELKSVLAEADVVIAPYLDTSLVSSGAITWALASGAPVIASRLPIFEEVNRQEFAIYLVPPADAELLAEAVMKVCNDDLLHDQLLRGASLYMQRNSWRSAALRCADLYRSRFVGAH